MMMLTDSLHPADAPAFVAGRPRRLRDPGARPGDFFSSMEAELSEPSAAFASCLASSAPGRHSPIHAP